MNFVLLKSCFVRSAFGVLFVFQQACSSGDNSEGSRPDRQNDSISKCGNGVIEADEDCESALELNTSCENVGLGPGTLTCDPTCQYDFTGCDDSVTDGSDLFTVEYETSSVISTVGIVKWSIAVDSIDAAHIVFGPDRSYGMKAFVDLSEPEYRTLLLGMKGSRDYHFRIVAKDGTTRYTSKDYTITTGPVTNFVQTLEVNVENEGARARGFIVSSLFQASGGGGRFPGDDSGALAFIVDADGDIVWWYSSSLNNITRARMSYNGKHLWMITSAQGNASGVEMVSMDGLDSRVFPMPATHDITAVAGDVMAFPSGGFTDCAVITEITPDGVTTPIFDTRQLSTGDCHENAIRFSETEELYTLSDIVLGDIFMIDRSGTMIGRLTDFSFVWGGRQHGHHLLDNSIVIYNNDSRTGQELSLNRVTMQSSVIWSYNSGYNSELLGDVQRLPNGNTLMTYSTAGRIHEVDFNSNLVMEMRFNSALGYAVWRKTLYGPPPDITL